MATLAVTHMEWSSWMLNATYTSTTMESHWDSVAICLALLCNRLIGLKVNPGTESQCSAAAENHCYKY